MKLILEAHNRRVPSQLNAKNWRADTPLPLPNRALFQQTRGQLVVSKGVIFVREAFTEMNAGLVIVLVWSPAGPLVGNDEVLTMLDSAWDVLPFELHGSHVHPETPLMV